MKKNSEKFLTGIGAMIIGLGLLTLIPNKDMTIIALGMFFTIGGVVIIK